MIERHWIQIAAVDKIPPREGRAVVIGDREVALFNLGDRFLAVDNRCPHKSGPLCDGIVTGASVVCPLHAWKINLVTGAVERPADGNGCARTFETSVVDGIVRIAWPTARAKNHAA